MAIESRARAIVAEASTTSWLGLEAAIFSFLPIVHPVVP
jgi:hypothetical protein